jgi:hypothetical protein
MRVCYTPLLGSVLVFGFLGKRSGVRECCGAITDESCGAVTDPVFTGHVKVLTLDLAPHHLHGSRMPFDDSR